jgi:DeoR family fructose operon transcriptional repressor
MLYEDERKKEITEYVQKNLRASVQELVSVFNVSESTIRRDLKDLEGDGVLKRTHGGAVFLETVNFEPNYKEKEIKFCNEKRNIAKKAASFIEDGDTILLDAGTTTLYLATELKRFSRLTIVTNSVVIANEVYGISGIEVFIIGGQLRQNTMALVGPLAQEYLDMLHVDKTFLGANGLTFKEGITTPNVLEAETKKKMISISDQTILLIDHSKIGRISFSKICGIQDIDKIVVDSDVPDHFIKEAEKSGVDIYIA